MNAELLAIGQSLAKKFPPKQTILPGLKSTKAPTHGNRKYHLDTKRMIKFAKVFGVSPKTFRQWRKDRQVPFVRVNRLLDEIAK